MDKIRERIGDRQSAFARLNSICHSGFWCEQMFTFITSFGSQSATENDLIKYSLEVWGGMSSKQWLEAFAGHAKIGEDKSKIATRLGEVINYMFYRVSI